MKKLFVFACAFLVYNFAQAQEIWHIKAVDPAGKLLDVKAFD